MRAKLEDNTQEALQFLLLGGAIVLGTRLLIAGADQLIGTGGDAALQEVIADHRRGFLLPANSWTIGAASPEKACTACSMRSSMPGRARYRLISEPRAGSTTAAA